MMNFFTKRLAREDRGFTLIELMVVVLIIAILIAIAIPTFLGARQRAQERAAQSSLRNTVTGAKTIYTDSEDYADASVTALTAAEPSLTFRAAASPSTGPNDMSINSGYAGSTAAPSPHNRFVAASMSRAGTCWWIQDIVGPAGTANAGTTWSKEESAAPADCHATGAPATATGQVAGGWFPEPGQTLNP